MTVELNFALHVHKKGDVSVFDTPLSFKLVLLLFTLKCPICHSFILHDIFVLSLTFVIEVVTTIAILPTLLIIIVVVTKAILVIVFR